MSGMPQYMIKEKDLTTPIKRYPPGKRFLPPSNDKNLTSIAKNKDLDSRTRS